MFIYTGFFAGFFDVLSFVLSCARRTFFFYGKDVYIVQGIYKQNHPIRAVVEDTTKSDALACNFALAFYLRECNFTNCSHISYGGIEITHGA